MSDNITADPHGILTFHDVVTEHRSGMAVYQTYMELSGKTPDMDLSYPHFLVQLKNGTFPARDLKVICTAMLICNLDPEPCLMAMYADCTPHEQKPDGDIDDEFCQVVGNLAQLADQVKSGTPLSRLARQDVVALQDAIGNICHAARQMSYECVAAIRTEAA